ncbi:hypothetical protein G6F62_010467 [Rhizopus arrhizus]|nr:hypothetical protein G6F62_010467 [Rhizopus arrhizus]
MVSMIPYYLVKKLGFVQSVFPTTKVIRYGDGVVETPVGLVKLHLVFSENVEVTHTFCVTKNSKTPLILGMDFLSLTKAIADQVNKVLIFRDDEGQTLFEVPTHDGDGVAEEYKSYAKSTDELEGKESMVLPVAVSQTPMNKKIKEIALEYEWSFSPGDSSLLLLGLKDEASGWNEDKVLQPETSLWSKLGLYAMPTIFAKESGGVYGLVILNASNKNVSIQKGTVLGKLYSAKSIPVEVEVLVSLEEVVQFLTDVYVDSDGLNKENGPTIIEGPIFKPSKNEIRSLVTPKLDSVNVVQKGRSHSVWCINSIAFIEPDQVKVVSMVEEVDFKFDINPQLNGEQQEMIRNVLWKYRKVFASSLQDVGRLKAKPFEIKVKEDVKPVKVTPRMVPHDANQWFKGYISQLLDMGLIEPCNGPWAAAVVLVSSDANNRKPRKRKVKARKSGPKLVKNSVDKPAAIWNLGFEEKDVNREDDEGDEGGAFHHMNQQWGATIYEKQDVDGKLSRYTSSVPKTLAGKKDPYRLCLDYKPINAATVDTGYPIPNINFLFTLLEKAEYFTVFDCLKGFWQLELHEDSRDYSGFATSFGQFRWTRLPMGLKGSPSAWQAVMDDIFFSELFKFLLIYIDDGLIFSSSFEDHVKHLDMVLAKAQNAGLSLSISKCKFGYQEVKLLVLCSGKVIKVAIKTKEYFLRLNFI